MNEPRKNQNQSNQSSSMPQKDKMANSTKQDSRHQGGSRSNEDMNDHGRQRPMSGGRSANQKTEQEMDNERDARRSNTPGQSERSKKSDSSSHRTDG